jgi:hypothetical protein
MLGSSGVGGASTAADVLLVCGAMMDKAGEGLGAKDALTDRRRPSLQRRDAQSRRTEITEAKSESIMSQCAQRWSFL